MSNPPQMSTQYHTATYKTIKHTFLAIIQLKAHGVKNKAILLLLPHGN